MSDVSNTKAKYCHMFIKFPYLDIVITVLSVIFENDLASYVNETKETTEKKLLDEQLC